MPAVYPARYPTDYLGGSLPGLVQKHELDSRWFPAGKPAGFFKPGHSLI